MTDTDRENQAAKVAASLPNEQAALLELAKSTVNDFNHAVVNERISDAKTAISIYEAIVWKLNGGSFLGCAAGENSPGSMVDNYCRAVPGDVPKWGQKGEFVVVVDGMRILVEFEGFGVIQSIKFVFHAVDLDKWFISSTGYKCHYASLEYGLTVDQMATDILNCYLQDKRHDISDRERDWLANSELPAALRSLEPPANRSAATPFIPEGYALVDVVLPSHKAFIVKKWAKEAEAKLKSIHDNAPAPDFPAADADKKNCRFQVGNRCQLVKVHHPVFEKDIGKIVVITEVSHRTCQVWAHDDLPPTYRVNRKGARVIDFNPRSVQSNYCFDQLIPIEECGENKNE